MNEGQNKILTTTISFALVGILVILAGVYYQLSKINDFNKANLTYKIENDMLQWEKEHREAKAWINSPDSTLKKNYDRWNFDDYLDIYEDLYALYQKDLVDKRLSYDFFSYYLESIYEANNFELKAMIESFRIEANDPTIYVGVENLYNEFEKERKTITGTHLTSTQK